MGNKRFKYEKENNIRSVLQDFLLDDDEKSDDKDHKVNVLRGMIDDIKGKDRQYRPVPVPYIETEDEVSIGIKSTNSSVLLMNDRDFGTMPLHPRDDQSVSSGPMDDNSTIGAPSSYCP